MKNFKNIFRVVCLLLVFAACKKDDSLGDVTQPVGIGGDVVTPTAIDKWILDSLTTPYNISVNYRWDPANASLYKTVTPPQESRIIPLFSALKRVFINPFNEETGSQAFMKKYTPKQFILIGSVEYDFYSVTLGQAEGGNSIVLFDVNQNFDKDATRSIRRVIHTAHHEFGHILHQTIAYPVDFKGTSTKLGLPGYTPTWFNVTDADAVGNGYATAYAMSGPDDDFVETLATMLSEGKTKWDEMKASTNATARTALQQKEDFVVNYLRQSWNIDFYSLQTRVQAASNALFPPPVVSAVYGYDKGYTSAQFGTATAFYAFPAYVAFPASAGFTTIFNSAKTKFAAEATSLTLRSFEWYINSATNIAVYLYYNPNTTAANAAAPTTAAIYNYKYVKDASDNYTLTYTGPGTNGTARLASATPLVDYFKNTFSLTWYESPNTSNFPKIKFTPVATPDNWFSAAIAP
jgi:substrate import-associated zinc metallohydrolase lipoprotein